MDKSTDRIVTLDTNTITSKNSSVESLSTASSSVDNSSSEKAKRRKHKNSKMGCPNCKKRRVKCSEDLPACFNCVKHKVKCGYLDYTKEQLKELREVKSQRALKQRPRNSKKSNDFEKEKEKEEEEEEEEEEEDSIQTEPSSLNINASKKKVIGSKRKRSVSTTPALESQRELANHNDNTTTNNSNNSNNNNNNNSNHHSPTSFSTEEQHNILTVTVDKLKLPSDNSSSSTSQLITQNYDNLLPIDSGNEITYPVYFMQNDCAMINQNTNLLISNKLLDHQSSCLLPRALILLTTFKCTKRVNINYDLKLRRMLKEMGPLVLSGEATLTQIREFYKLWLNSFVWKGYTSHFMFYCLLNLSTNYLISNCFGDSYKYYSSSEETSSSSRGTQLDNVRRTCLVKSIKYYDEVIKGLRITLKANLEPDVVSSVSYILSLMSVYDPESSLDSTICFRDGMFNVLSYNANSMTEPVIIPVYLRLVTNVSMSVYIPGYNPSFLSECQHLLTKFGEILLPIVTRSTSTLEEYSTHRFLYLKYHELLAFLNDAIQHYIPQLNESLADMELQQRLLYEIIMRWVKIFPGRFIAGRKSQGIMEKILYLFYKAFKRSFFAICPQLKYFFLRDLTSPLMMDVFASDDDFDIFDKDLQMAASQQFSNGTIAPYIGELRYIAAYLIRMITYFQIRLSILYKYLVHDGSKDVDMKITEVNQWRSSINNIIDSRREFMEKVGLMEVHISSFTRQYIRKENYPQKLVQQHEVDGNYPQKLVQQHEVDGNYPQKLVQQHEVDGNYPQKLVQQHEVDGNYPQKLVQQHEVDGNYPQKLVQQHEVDGNYPMETLAVTNDPVDFTSLEKSGLLQKDYDIR
ncbi:hypothetical protein KGF56_001187 [Candida oxycetoniae]|uniref:Zn(2)-C6 fungal-type domain-containing protein n=1 Tax=Candida oxycetoniae TaxID=497107 RepID=A0AAI9SZ88_9ASCO|nr:uncharacterized protein KGF56_001187 [Candida oxycetoniae]KAI3405968.2 hypothetical protein KGF56_001187 [Candida oxycetoniae]